MQEQSSKPVLTLVVDHDIDSYTNWKLFSLQLSNGHVLRYGPPSEPANIEKGLLSLSCLILHQTYLRKVGMDYSEMPTEQHLQLKTIWSASKATKTPSWLFTLFNENPFDQFIKSSGGGKNFKIWFTDQIELRVESNIDLNELSIGSLLKSRNEIATPKYSKDTKFDIEISRGNDRISVKNRGSFLRHGDEIQICIEANFQSCLSIFWISGNLKIHQIYPYIDPKICDDEKTPTIKNLSQGFQLQIPENTTVSVDSTTGVETCVALVRNKPFTKTECSLIEKILNHNNTLRNEQHRILSPEQKELRLTSHLPSNTPRKSVEMGLSKSKKLSDWEEVLVQELQDYSDRIFCLHIPVR